MSIKLPKANLSQRFLKELLSYCSTNDLIEKVTLFGSRARMDFDLRSDIDLAILTNGATHSDQNMIEYNILEMSTHLKIDVVFFDRLKKEKLIANIKRDGVVLYEQGKAL